MCGIWGVFPNDLKGFYATDESAVTQIMTLTSLRGDDSTGIALISDPAIKPRVWKGIGGPSYIINGDAWEKISEFMIKKAKVMFGHGRAATKGIINAKNAHPFTHEHITLVHNGTIHWGLTEEHKEAETEVDSHALTVAIAKKGLVEDLSDISGAYALIVHDAKEKCIYIVRNDERPLHRLVLHDKHIVMSEADALRYLAYRNNISQPKVEVYPKWVIFKYDLATATWTTDNTLKEKMEKKYWPTSSYSQSTPTGGQKNYGHKWSQYGDSGKSEVDSYVTIELLCVKIEEAGAGNYKYRFTDDDGNEYVGVSSYKESEREGQMCLTRKHTRITVKSTGEITRFVKYRELEWWDPSNLKYNLPRYQTTQVETKKSTEPPKTTPSQTGDGVTDGDTPVELTHMTHVLTHNGRRLPVKQWLTMCMKQDCSICQGPVLSNEAENTYVTDSDTLICSECIANKKHFQYGYGQ